MKNNRSIVLWPHHMIVGIILAVLLLQVFSYPAQALNSARALVENGWRINLPLLEQKYKTSTIIASDDFNACALDTDTWNFVNPLGDGSISLNGTQILLSVPAGLTHDIGPGGVLSPRIMQTAANTNFEVEVKFESPVNQSSQMQGVVVEQDAGNYLRFDFQKVGAETLLFASSTTNGSQTVQYSSAIPDSDTLFMRVKRQNSRWRQQYSTDGITWVNGANFVHPFTVAHIGVYAGNAGSSAPAHTAVVDYFINTAQPIVPEDALTYQNLLNLSVNGNGTISSSPDKPSYICSETVQLTATAEAGWAFTGWSGDLSSSQNPVTLVVNDNKSVAAAFVEAQDTLPPAISGVQVVTTSNGAVVTWQTDEPASSRVKYGLTNSYELGEVTTSALLTQHSLTVGNLLPGTQYYYQISSTDSSGNAANTEDVAFTTLTDTTLIDVWYGDYQRFGYTGTPQEWINILGNVSSPDGIASLSYSLNGGPWTNLSIGPDDGRLEKAGDFNIDIHRTALVSGANHVLISALTPTGGQELKLVGVDYQPGSIWPLPYTIDWSTAARIEDAAQVVDGKWGLEAGGVRPMELGYDRLIAVGDLAWQDYEAEFPVTIHNIDLAGAGGMSGEPGLGLLMHWTGHTDNPISGRQPKTGYIPFGDIGWWRWSSLDQARLEFIGSGISKNYLPDLGVPYTFKMRSETVPGIERIYSIKVWKSGDPEPIQWDLTHKVPLSNLGHGSMLLVAHHVDATFGNVSVRPLSGTAAPRLTTSVVGSGSVTVDPNLPEYTFGQLVTLTATPGEGWYFQGWAGDLSGSTNPVSISMTGDKFIAAVFGSHDVIPSDIISDDFNACTVNMDLWTFTNPLGDGTYLANGTQLLLSVPGGVSHDLWSEGNFAPRLMQPAANTDFGIEARFESSVNLQYQMQGLLVEQDPNNYMRVEFHHDGGSVRLFAASIANGVPTIQYNNPIAFANVPLHLRLNRQADGFTVLYSEDGQNWIVGASFNHNLVVTQVGVFAGNAGGNPPAHTAVIDTFFNTSSPIVPEDPLSYQYALNTTTVGSGVINRSPNQQDYSCNATVELAAEPELGWSFSGWSGDLTGAENPVLINMDGPKSITAVFIETPVGPSSGIVSDDFSALVLNQEVWTFVNPVGDGSLTLNGTQALLSVPAGVSHDVWEGGNFAPRLMQTTNNTDFQIEVKFDSLMLDRFQMQGIIIEQDGLNFLRFDFYSDGTSLYAFAAGFANGSPVALSNSTTGSTTGSMFMRVKRTGDLWTMFYSLDGQNWFTGASFNWGLTASQVGVFAGNAGDNPAHTAAIDYFFNTASPIVPQD